LWQKIYQDRQLIEITKSEYRISGQTGNQILKSLLGSPLNRDFRFAPTGLSGLGLTKLMKDPGPTGSQIRSSLVRFAHNWSNGTMDDSNIPSFHVGGIKPVLLKAT
jgi:hypothetical protein